MSQPTLAYDLAGSQPAYAPAIACEGGGVGGGEGGRERRGKKVPAHGQERESC
jgi:hypothetical protein